MSDGSAAQGGRTTSADGFPMPVPVERLLMLLKRSVHFVLSTGLAAPSLLFLAGTACERFGWRVLAARIYSGALAWADRSSSRHVFKVRQLWEYTSERNLSMLGRQRVEDPLFSCAVSPAPGDRPGWRRRSRAPGYYDVRITHRGIRVDGMLRPGIGNRRVEATIDGRVVYRTTATRVLPGLSIFAFGIWRDGVVRLPRTCRLGLRIEGGEALLFKGAADTLLHIPHGEGHGGNEAKPAFDKKGFLVRDSGELADLRQGFLETYQRAMEFFESRVGTPLFLLYGTLLGQHRSGDFIPGDDDFDVGYCSMHPRSGGVRDEGMRIAVELVKAGFLVTLNRNGRLFRLRLPGTPAGCHLDVHAVWWEFGSMWIHPRANLDCGVDDFLPAKEAMLHGRRVKIPARPEAFLAAYYGRDWRTPNPAYSTSARIFPAWKTRYLARSFVTPALYRRMQEELKDEPSKEGRLVAIGMQSIYPLEEYERLCHW